MVLNALENKFGWEMDFLIFVYRSATHSLENIISNSRAETNCIFISRLKKAGFFIQNASCNLYKVLSELSQ